VSVDGGMLVVVVVEIMGVCVGWMCVFKEFSYAILRDTIFIRF